MELQARTFHILSIEDSASDRRLISEFFGRRTGSCHIHFATDGEEASAFIFRQGKYESAPRPDLILLDLNLPRKNGREVLVELKSSEELKSIPVIVFTTSCAREEVTRCYDSYANCFFTKPAELDAFIELMEVIEELWIERAQLPGSSDRAERSACLA